MVGFGAGGVNFGSSDFQNTIIGEAVKAAVEKMSTEVIADRRQGGGPAGDGKGSRRCGDRRPNRSEYRVQGRVKVGDQLAVERVSQEIKDPATGKVIRRMTSPVGVIRVVDVDEQSAVANIVSGIGLQGRRPRQDFDVTPSTISAR